MSLTQQALDAWHAFDAHIKAGGAGSAESYRLHDALVAANNARDAANRPAPAPSYSPSGLNSPVSALPINTPISTLPIDPTPPAWNLKPKIEDPKGVKQADPDIVIFNTTPISPEFLIETNYEDLAGMELINISRSDIINGANVSYSPIKNLSALRRRYNPNNIISMPELSSSYFSRFGIDLILRGISKPFFDAEGNLVIEIQDVRDDEIIDVEISQSGTINEVDFL
jgi:hypothetical protein